MAKHDPINIPTIRGRIAERLSRATPREREELTFNDESLGEVTLRTPNERGTVALACLILENLREDGGSRAPKRTLETVLKKTLATMSPKEIMDIEIEAYEVLLWIAKAIEPDWEVEAVPNPDEINPRDGHPDLIRFAIATNQDLELDYYSRNRGELTKRKITPISLEAETYLHAYCHLRRDERIFRISRIADLKPVGGWSKLKRKSPSIERDRDAQAEDEKDDGQMSLLE